LAGQLEVWSAPEFLLLRTLATLRMRTDTTPIWTATFEEWNRETGGRDSVTTFSSGDFRDDVTVLAITA